MRLDSVLHIVTAHCEGVVCDVVVGGMPPIPGDTALAKKQYFERNLDHLRTLLTHEPRGTESQCINILVPSTRPEASFGVLILEKEDIVDMSGGNVISVATVLLETGLVPMVEPVTEVVLDTPAGLVTLRCTVRDGRVVDATFTNQPSFVVHRDAGLDVAGLGRFRVDVAWGGMWYLLVDAVDLGLELHPREHRQIIELAERFKAAGREQLDVRHPTEPALADYIQNTLIAGPLERRADGVLHSANAVVVSPGWIDRCPCGTGTCARMALLHARGELAAGETFLHDSLIGTRFTGRIVGTPSVGGIPAIVPTVTGRAWITGTAQKGVDPTDPFPHGFSMETLGRVDARPR